jgi:hypothetical protein
MSAKAILGEIKPLGREGYKNILLRHGVTEPCYGVKIEELNETSCKVPFAPEYIAKIEKRGAIGKKRKTVKC